ncbi:MAG: hypothetical protein WA240_05650 [Nitrospirota bacterium]
MNHERLKAIIDNSNEKEYNVSLARRLIKRFKTSSNISKEV